MSLMKRGLDMVAAAAIASGALAPATAHAVPLSGCNTFVCLRMSGVWDPSGGGRWITNGVGSITWLAPSIGGPTPTDVTPFFFLCAPFPFDCGLSTPVWTSAGRVAGQVMGFNLNTLYFPTGAPSGVHWDFIGLLVEDRDGRLATEGPTFLAPSATLAPEPATVALVVEGLGLVAAIAWRRRRAA